LPCVKSAGTLEGGSRVVPERAGGVRRKRVRAIELSPNPSFFVVKALDVVVSSCANRFKLTVRTLRHYAVRVPDEISWAAAALGVPEAALVVSMIPARLEGEENTARLVRSHADIRSHLAPAAASRNPERAPPEALCGTDTLLARGRLRIVAATSARSAARARLEGTALR
jgi:hypothetical protein